MTISTSITEELAAIRNCAAIYPLTDRAFLRITGADATRWLNGMVTNNIAALAPGEGNYNFLLNAQGRIQGDCTIYREPGDGPATYLLGTDKSQIEAIQSHLDKFIIMDDVELHRIPDSLNTVLLMLGPNAAQVLTSLHLPTPAPNRIVIAESPIGHIAVMTTGETNCFALCAEESQIERLHKQIDIPEISNETLEAFRVISAVPKFGPDITEKYLPQETAQTHALHFSKGCYLGQEIVERIHSRGQVHRIFTQFTLTGEMPTLPAPLESNGKPAGELTSAALIDGTIHALGYARREFLETHQPLTYPGGTATPSASKLTT